MLPHPGAVLLWSFYNPPRQEQVQIARWGVGRWILLTGLTGADQQGSETLFSIHDSIRADFLFTLSLDVANKNIGVRGVLSFFAFMDYALL